MFFFLHFFPLLAHRNQLSPVLCSFISPNLVPPIVLHDWFLRDGVVHNIFEKTVYFAFVLFRDQYIVFRSNVENLTFITLNPY